MICKNCGAKNDNDALYCKKCGKVIKSLRDSKFTLMILLITTIFIILVLSVSVSMITTPQNNPNNVEAVNDQDFTSSGIPLSQIPNLASEISKLGRNFENINYGSTSLNKNQCIYLLAKAILMINNGQEGNIPINSYNSPYNPYGTISNGEISKDQYVDMAERTVTWMDNNGATPNYIGIATAGQPDISPDNLLIIFSNVLIKYESTGSLPNSITF